MGSGEAEYAVGIAVVARHVGRCERGAVRAVLAQFEDGKAVVARSERGDRSRNETENEALQDERIDDRNAGQPAPQASIRHARLLRLDAHRTKA
jgi:hypothetical protein